MSINLNVDELKSKLQPETKVLHRYFGLGTIKSFEKDKYLIVEFDEETLKNLKFPAQATPGSTKTFIVPNAFIENFIELVE